MTDSKKLWGGRFSGSSDPEFAAFNNSFSFDVRLFAADVEGSIAYCGALLAANVISSEEAALIESGLRTILENGKTNPEYFATRDAEDVHSFVEAELVELIGDAGRKLHTGRSRNDQVATDFRLWTRSAIEDLRLRLNETAAALLDFADSNMDVVVPGYTHLQRAQPVLLAHWCLAYFEMLGRDDDRLRDIRHRVNIMPLGSAALAGNSFPIDRAKLARDLGFENISKNSLDAVSDRDFCVEFVNACALILVHLSRLAEDVILYSTKEFGFFELGDAVATGSSLMPQKKNPDSMELVRGKSGRVFGDLVGLLTVLKGLPLAYNKDMQEDKEAVFDAFDTASDCLRISSTVFRNMSVNAERAYAAASTGYMNATALADYLVRRGMPFREAHENVGKIVVRALELGCELPEMPITELKAVSKLIDVDVFQSLSLEKTLASHAVTGGTAPKRVREALAEARSRLKP